MADEEEYQETDDVEETDDDEECEECEEGDDETDDRELECFCVSDIIICDNCKRYVEKHKW